MIPFSSFFFFILIGVLLLPTIILGLRGKRMQGYNMFATVVALALIFSKDAHGALLLFLFTVWQVLIIRLYLSYRLKANQASVFYMAVVASILPLVLSKVLPFFLTHQPHQPPPMNWLSFLGISYLTFKGVQLIIETRDGLIKKKMPIHRLVYFIVFFPTISSGPIDRYRRFEKDMDTPLKRKRTVIFYTPVFIKFLSASYTSSLLVI